MLIALITILFLTMGGGGAAVKKDLKKAIADKDSAKAAVEVWKGVMDDHKAFAKSTKKTGGKIFDLNLDYDAKPEEFMDLFGKIGDDRESMQGKFLDNTEKMKASMNKEEWTEVFGKS